MGKYSLGIKYRDGRSPKIVEYDDLELLQAAHNRHVGMKSGIDTTVSSYKLLRKTSRSEQFRDTYYE